MGKIHNSYAGWLLDVYPEQGKGAIIWLIGKDEECHRFTQDFPVTFYVGGYEEQNRQLAAFFAQEQIKSVQKTKRTHLFHGSIDVLAIQIERGSLQPGIFRRMRNRFPKLEYYDADISMAQRYFAKFHLFPLALCKVTTDEQQNILDIGTNDSKWDLKPEFPQLRLLEAEPVGDPNRALPKSLRVTFRKQTKTLDTKDPKAFLLGFQELVELHDPDVIRTRFGDKWLFPYLFSISKETGIPFNPNRDKTRLPIRVEANQFESYGRPVYRDEQTLLLGRLHIDPQNSMAFTDNGLEGTYETARLSSLPIQNAARRSAGGAFVGMQVAASFEAGILIPMRKQQRENFKTGTQLVKSDNGGLIFKPVTGIHQYVAEIDFFSMYPSIMTKWNISAETVGSRDHSVRWVPGIQVPIAQDKRGIVTSILSPILAKRHRAQAILEPGAKKGYDLKYVKVAKDFLKGLGWVSYGYQGFNGNRIGSIEAHEAINAVSRDTIAKAKEAAEDLGYEVLHLYVDSLFIKVSDISENLAPLLKEIQRRTELKVELEGILRWIVFLPSKQNERLSVPNCYFGVFENGELKRRGIMARRGDTPVYIKDVQERAIQLMADEFDFDKLWTLIPKLVYFFRFHYQQLRKQQMPIDQLVISQTLSRDLEEFKVKSPAGRAGFELQAAGKALSAGHAVEFLRTKKPPFVTAWHLVSDLQVVEIDADWYCEQLLRAADEVMHCFGIPKETLQSWLKNEAAYFAPSDFVDSAPDELPLVDYVLKHQNAGQKSAL